MTLKIYSFLILSFSFFCLSAAAQEGSYDSILELSKTSKYDTVKVKSLNILSERIWGTGEYTKSRIFAEQAIALSDKNSSSTNPTEKFIFLKEKANAYNNIAIVERFLGNYTEALKNHLSALKVREEIGDKRGTARSYLGIGSIYTLMGKNEEGLNYKFKSKKIYEEINDSTGIAKVCNHIAFIYYDLGKYDSVTKYNNEALMIFLKKVDIRGMSDVYDLFGLTYMKTKEYDIAIENFKTCLQYRTILGAKNDIAESNRYLGLVYTEMGQYKKAEGYYNTALEIAKEVGSKEHMKNCYKGLVDIDSATHDFAAAFKHYKLFTVYRDSLVGQKTTETINQIAGQYEADKKDQIKVLEESQKEQKRQAELKQQNIVLYSVSGGLLLMFILAAVIYRGSKQKQTANFELLAKNEIIEKQKQEVEEKQKEIIDSINYAKRIQQSQLPTEKYINKSLNRLKGK
ncbi:hypothetical protein BH10BAC1_BH10BAC1_06030 [soil metagenome]